ncbi:unnamed protein product [Rhodiola kirilowii]
MRTVEFFVVKVAVPSPAVMTAAEGHSTWRTPLPYLFGGLAAMFFLITTSLLFLACSYWKYTNRLEREERDLEGAGGQRSAGEAAVIKVPYVEKFAVIMPGDENPTWLATPRCFRVVDLVDEEGEKESLGFEEVAKEKMLEETTSHEEVDRHRESVNSDVD